MTAALGAGAAYFALVFAAGFALGTIRVLAVGPGPGNVAAVLVELPVMLAIAWLACGRIARRFAVPERPAPRAAMGGLAFALLMLAELGVSILAFGRTPAEHLATYRNAASQLGLAAQLAFALFPLVQAATARAR